MPYIFFTMVERMIGCDEVVLKISEQISIVSFTLLRNKILFLNLSILDAIWRKWIDRGVPYWLNSNEHRDFEYFVLKLNIWYSNNTSIYESREKVVIWFELCSKIDIYSKYVIESCTGLCCWARQHASVIRERNFGL